jgi:hypothetical protein
MPPGVPAFPIYNPPVAGQLPIIPPAPTLPPTTPPPGSVTLPPNAPEQPVNPITPPKFILVNYPGIGWVIVAAPALPMPKGK